MAKVTVIPAVKRSGNSISINEKPKLRVAAYCRVSTDSDEQATSYETQVEHYTSYIKMKEEWEFAGIYADDGISGTNTKKREEFNRMIRDCNNGKIDMIITKSISRFARNTLDCLRYIRELKEKNIPVFFEKENINTMDSKGEVLLTIMASLAQQESQSLSQNVKMGYQFRYQNGQLTVNHNRFLGYTKDKEGNLIIDEEQAVVVKRIYREYLEGKSLIQIGRGLEADGILTGAGKTKWRTGSIMKILQNEKYIGDALLQKTYTVDFLTKKRVKNDGIMPQYYVENSHEGIIPRDIFAQVQEEIKRRKNLSQGEKSRTYSSKFAMTGLVRCPKCGDYYRRIKWNNNGKKSVVWRCCSRINGGPKVCDAETILEDDLKRATIRAFNLLHHSKERSFEILKNNIEEVISEMENTELEQIEMELDELQKDLMDRACSKQDYEELAKQLLELRERKQEMIQIKNKRNSKVKRMEEMEKYLDEVEQDMEEYDELLVRRYIENITVYDERIEVEFKSGIRRNVGR